jgi:hypothetical protein
VVVQGMPVMQRPGGSAGRQGFRRPGGGGGAEGHEEGNGSTAQERGFVLCHVWKDLVPYTIFSEIYSHDTHSCRSVY